MNRHILAAAMALVWCGQAAACDCTPDSLAFQDTFFKYCDEARAAYEAGATFAKGNAVQPTVAPRADGAGTARGRSAVAPADLGPDGRSVRERKGI